MIDKGIQEVINLNKEELYKIIESFCNSEDIGVRSIHKKLILLSIEYIDNTLNEDYDIAMDFLTKFDNLRKEFLEKIS